MTTLADELDTVAVVLEALAARAFAGELRSSTDDSAMSTIAAGARVLRAVEAISVASVGEIIDRCDAVPHADRLTTKYGCRSVNELVQRATRISSRRAGEIVKVAHAVREQIAPSSGERLSADLPEMRAALAEGVVGVDGVLAVADPLRGMPGGATGVLAADRELAASARGDGPDSAPPACADELRALATVWATYLDQDGAEPRDARALRKRGLTLGMCRDGLVPIRGELLPEVAAQLKLGFDSLLNPKVDGRPITGPHFRIAGSEIDVEIDPDAPVDALADTRTRPQKQHDALASMLSKVAGTLPTLGGAAPTLVVSVRQHDLSAATGFAHIDGVDEPVSLAVARHVACSGAVQRVLTGDDGRIVSITTTDRIFNHHQRRAIGLRDGGCFIPGCHVPAAWCEFHHVTASAHGGPTTTDNGVPLCWWHHRTIDTSGWQIRMNHGVPEIRGPAWWDPGGRWRPRTSSPTRLRDRLDRSG